MSNLMFRVFHALEDLEPLFKIFYKNFVCEKVLGKITDKYMEKSKTSFWRNLSTDTPPNFFSKILCYVASVYNLYFFQESRYAEIIRH